jgi:hypothetical protein
MSDDFKKKDYSFKVRLGYTKKELYGSREPVFLEGFKWTCEWYWGGGYIGNKHFHAHFDGAFLETPDIRGHSLGNFITPWSEKKRGAVVISNGCSVWEKLETFLDEVPARISKNWWRIKDLYKQFYTLKDAAQVFQYGGHCTSDGRNPAEINKEMADMINKQIADIIIPEIIKVVVK